MVTIRSVTSRIREIPLKHVFATAQDSAARTVSRGITITVEMNDGLSASGESVPVQYVTGETEVSVIKATARANELLTGRDPFNWRDNLGILKQHLPHDYSATAAIEIATFHWLAAQAGLPLWKYFGGAIDRVDTDITLSISDDAPIRAREAHDPGFNMVKTKVGSGSVDNDVARLVAINSAAPGLKYRVDANQGYSPAEALQFIDQVLAAGIDLQLMEQPVDKMDLAGLDHVARHSPVPIFADEAVKTPEDALKVVSQSEVNGINVKVMKSGILGTLDIIAIAKAANRKLMIGCMLESRAGIAASLALACGTGAFDYIDLDSHMLLNEQGENKNFSQTGSTIGFW
ncbi:MAG: dipeptide epimerase [Chthonomonadales bacterium]